MSSPVSTAASDEDEEGKLYQFIYELKDDEDETEGTQIPSSPEQSPIHLDIQVERRTRTAGIERECSADISEDLEMEMLEKIQGIKKGGQIEQSVEKKPWNKPNANVSDFFNYGFIEETWKAYCKKRAKLQAFQRKHKNKMMAQKHRGGFGAEKSSAGYSSSGKSNASSRKSEGNFDGGKGRAGCSSRDERSPCRSDGANKTQVAKTASESSHKENIFSALDEPRTGGTPILFPFVSPSPFLFQQGPDSEPRSGYFSLFRSSGPKNGQAEVSDQPSTALSQFSSGNNPQSFSSNEAAKSGESYAKKREHDKDKDRAREHDPDKKGRGCRHREKPSTSSSSSSSSHHRGKKRAKHRSSRDQNHRQGEFKGAAGRKKKQERSKDSERTSKSSSSGGGGRSSSGSRKHEEEDATKPEREARNKKTREKN